MSMTNLPTPGEDCWRIEQAARASVIVDADNYFRLARDAMLKAKRRIMLIGWDFDPAISLIREDEARDGAPVVIGDFITWLVERTPDLEISCCAGMSARSNRWRARRIWSRRCAGWRIHASP